MSLLEGEKGNSYQVLFIHLDTAIQKRLEILGMTSGSKIDILNKKKNGALIIKIRGTRFALGKEFAAGIIVGKTA